MIMTSAEVTSGFTQDNFDAFLAERNEPEWLTASRQDAWRVFQELPLPRRNEEEWMRTDLRLLHLDRFSPPVEPLAGQPSARDHVPALTRGVEIGGKSLGLNSQTLDRQLSEELRRRGVVFGPLAEVAREHGDVVQQHLFQRAFDIRYDKFAALHAACWSGGACLYVPRGVEVAEPLHVMSLLSEGQADLGHILVILEEGASATLLYETASLGDSASGFHCGGTELFVGKGAKLRFVSLQDWGPGVWHFAHQKGIVDTDGLLQWTVGALGGRLAKVNQHVALVGTGAHAQVNGVMFTEGKQHLAYHTLQHHEATGCTSDLLYKGALQDHSRIVWRGMIKVDHEAQKTDGYQRNDNLMLSPDSRADSIPGLEIEADDVRCTHGSTSGRVDEELIFYAQSRGLTRDEATRMIVTGFFQSVLDRITISNVHDALSQAIGQRVRAV